jgi:hypothetical protein
MRKKAYIIVSIFVLLALCGIMNQAKAQMEAARKVSLDVDTTVQFNVKRSVVWNLVKDPAQWDKLFAGNLKSFKTQGTMETSPGNPPSMTLNIVFNNGAVRNEQLRQIQPEYRFIVMEAINPIPEGITDNNLGITVNVVSENACSLKYFMTVNGPQKAKNELVDQLSKEMRLFLKGLSKMVNVAE